MLQEKSNETARVNARKTDVFDVFNFKHYMGPNPYLGTAALVFDLAQTGASEPLPIALTNKLSGLRKQTAGTYFAACLFVLPRENLDFD